MQKIKKNIAISDSGFVFDPGTGDSYSLNPTGLEIVQLIKSGKNFQEILHEMLEKYEVDEESFERYFYDFTATLKQLRLTEPNGED
ncbi:HPr-rel-A system PqqD family peptide chaperone [Shivajiella indica]|uniref:HPr-rel-A system PqqD family peptide chaperone n=1 Tax=Shivajiella indica TaxID=872115 RepID=A0ABW5B4H7_9BACT